MLAFRSSSEVALAFRCAACGAADTVLAPGPNSPPTKADAARNRGMKKKYRRWDK
jgi:hypothetical protein